MLLVGLFVEELKIQDALFKFAEYSSMCGLAPPVQLILQVHVIAYVYIFLLQKSIWRYSKNFIGTIPASLRMGINRDNYVRMTK